MAKLTSERVNGIKTGFWSPAKKDELVQKLGPIEKNAEKLLDRVCGEFCVYAYECRHKRLHPDAMSGICPECPVRQLAELVYGPEGRA